MRRVVTARVLPRGLGDAAGCALSAYDNQTIASTTQTCGEAALSAYPTLGLSLSQVWAEAEQGAASGAATGAEAYIAVETVFNALLAIGASTAAAALQSLITTITGGIVDELVAVGATDLIGSTAVGGTTFGVIGAVIGFIIGLITVLIQFLNPHTVQLTNGTVVASKDYVQTNLANAQKWLNNQKTLTGVTPLYFSNIANLFLANPTWLWANQALTGLCQPIPPEQGTGSAVDLVFTQTPGAFELLSRAQFSEACTVVALNPNKVPFFMSVPQPTGTAPNQNPNFNPHNYNPLYSQADITAWCPDGYQIDSSWSAIHTTDYTVNSAACSSAPNSQSDESAPLLQSSNPSQASYGPYVYSSCPNLATNNNTTDSSGKITGQTDIAQGIYMLQVLYPALTADQCLIIFAANQSAYIRWLGQASAWANNQCSITSADLGPGSYWGLGATDVANILAGWVPASKDCDTTIALQPGPQTAYFGGTGSISVQLPAKAVGWIVTNGVAASGSAPYLLPSPTLGTYSFIYNVTGPSGVVVPQVTTLTVTTKPVSSASTALKTTALLGGLGLLGLAVYAKRTGVSIPRAAKNVFGSTKSFVTREARKIR